MIRQAMRRNSAKQQVSRSSAIPAPTGGWNATDPLSNMPAEDAVILDNWIPRPGYVEVRRGSIEWLTGASDPTETLLVYRGATEEMYAVAGGDIFDATTTGSFTSPVVTALTNSRLQYVNFSNDGGSFLILVNGADTPFHYDASAWADLTITGSSGSITLVPEDLIDVLMHKRRLWFVEKDSLRAWFLDINGIQGAANLLDLGPVFQLGGVIQCIGTWSLDGGQGPDDYLVLVSDQGEVAVYQGSDPTDVNNWALVGVFSVGIPLGRRALFKVGADLQLLTTQGVIPLSQALALDRSKDNTVAITAKIQDAFATSAQSYLSNFGWQGLTYPKGQVAIYNIPVEELVTSYQYVQNAQTGAWCRFTGLNAFCWAIYNDDIYFGGLSSVFQWDQGITDAGTDLTADLKTAFNYFGNRSALKHFTMLQPNLLATSDVSPAIDVLTDFVESIPTSVPITTVSAVDDLAPRNNWTSATGMGYCAAVRMRTIFSEDPDMGADLQDGDGNLIVDGGGDTIIIASSSPVNDSRIQAIAFNVLFEAGGVL